MIPLFALLATGMAADTNVACQTSLDEDKPACVEVTRYVPEPGGSNVFKTTLAFFSHTITNSKGEVITQMDLPPELMDRSLPTNPFLAPVGISMVLNPGTDTGALGPGVLTSLQRLPAPAGTNSAGAPRWPPNIPVKGPPQGIVTQPQFDIMGMSDQPLHSVTFDVLNDSRALTNQQGFVTDGFFDGQLGRYTTNSFECFDVTLAPGTNLVLIHCHYPNGFTATIRKSYTLRLDLRIDPPKFHVTWPVPGCPIAADQVTIRGVVDDTSTKMTCEVAEGLHSTNIEGLVERSGRFWLEHVPLWAKTNHIKITATDVVGNSAVSRLTLVKSDDRIVISPVPPEQLWQMQAMVTGRISPPDRNLWVNGVQANVRTNGEWTARSVPLSKEGVALFDVMAQPATEPPITFKVQNEETNSGIKPVESVTIQTNYTPAETILNASRPAYGAFNLHLEKTAGKSFVLQASTNLVDWTPILTNLNSAATFDFSQTNMLLYGCRFFRIQPIR